MALSTNPTRKLSTLSNRSTVRSSAASKEEMVKKTNAGMRTKEELLAEFVITGDEFLYPVEERVPPGTYLSEICEVDVRMKGEYPILDVNYRIWSYKGEYLIRKSYRKPSRPWDAFKHAMKVAGLKKNDDITKCIGIQEKIVLEYGSVNSDIGRISNRIPYYDPENETDPEEDDDFDDFLAEEDE